MKYLQHGIYAVLLTGLFLACDREDKSCSPPSICWPCGNHPPVFCDDHYIAEFSIPDYAYSWVGVRDNNRNGRYDEGDTIWLNLGTVPQGVDIYSTNSRTFQALVEQLGDTTYVGSRIITALLDTVLRIDVTCKSAYDAQHAAGESLNDLFEVSYGHAKLFIDNGYSDDFEGVDLPEGMKHVGDDYFRETLDNFNSHGEDNFPVDRDFRLYLQSPPAQAGEYTFTTKVTTNRRTYLDSTAFEWQGPIPP